MNIVIRNAEVTDAKAIHDIYEYYVNNTFATFTEENPTIKDYSKTIIETQKEYPYLWLVIKKIQLLEWFMQIE